MQTTENDNKVTQLKGKKTVKNHAPGSGGLTATETMSTAGELPPENTVGPQAGEMDREAHIQEKRADSDREAHAKPVQETEEVTHAEQATQAAVEERQKPQARVPAIVANENKYLEARDLDSRYRLAQAFHRSGMVPKSYKDAASVFAGMELALELGLRPFTALKNIAVINGNPSLWGDLPLALVRRSKEMARIEEFLFDKEYNRICFANKNLNATLYGAVCRTWDVGAEPDAYYETVFTMDDARVAGLLSKDNVWKTYPKRMIQMRARSQNLKDKYGHALLGVDIAEYDYNTIPQRDVTPEGRVLRDGTVEKDVAGELNKTLNMNATGGAAPKDNGAIHNGPKLQ